MIKIIGEMYRSQLLFR